MEIYFEIDRKNILNSNELNGMNRFKKGAIASELKKIGYEKGIETLPEETRKAVEKRKEIIDVMESNKIIKSRITKRMKKNNPGLQTKELKNLVEEEYAEMGLDPETKPEEIEIENLFNKFEIKVKVYSPTNRRLDPANLYPTIKHIIDGLTIAGLWVDDDWKHLEEISFKYGGVNPNKVFGFYLDIRETQD